MRKLPRRVHGLGRHRQHREVVLVWLLSHHLLFHSMAQPPKSLVSSVASRHCYSCILNCLLSHSSRSRLGVLGFESCRNHGCVVPTRSFPSLHCMINFLLPSLILLTLEGQFSCPYGFFSMVWIGYTSIFFEKLINWYYFSYSGNLHF
jgi:hypothetical protein